MILWQKYNKSSKNSDEGGFGTVSGYIFGKMEDEQYMFKFDSCVPKGEIWIISIKKSGEVVKGVAKATKKVAKKAASKKPTKKCK